jgi:putative ABC transport system ATP-binding protein
LVAFLVPHTQPTANMGLRNNSASSAISLSEVRFAWRPESAPVLDISRLEIESGQHIFVAGPSGSGKSSLLGLLAGVSVPQAGQIRILGQRLEKMGGSERDRFRADHMGVIFQMFNLIPYLTVVENVTLPCRFSRRRYEQADSNGGLTVEAVRLLSRLGISDPLLNRPVTELSVGQQQRVAAARALIGSPEIVIADEPTSALDADHRHAFLQLLFEECRNAWSTLVFVSHDTSLSHLFDQTVALSKINRAGSAISMDARRDS